MANKQGSILSMQTETDFGNDDTGCDLKEEKGIKEGKCNKAASKEPLITKSWKDIAEASSSHKRSRTERCASGKCKSALSLREVINLEDPILCSNIGISRLSIWCFSEWKMGQWHGLSR